MLHATRLALNRWRKTLLKCITSPPDSSHRTTYDSSRQSYVLTTIILGFGALAVLFLLSLRRSTGIQQYTSLLIDASLKDKGSAASALQRWEAKPDTTILAQWKDGSTEEASQHPHVYPMDHAQYRYYVLSLPDMHIDDVASLLEIEYVGPVGEITSYHLFRTAALAHPFYYSVKPSDSLLTRISINNTTTDNYVSIKKRSLTKRDISAVSENDPVIKRYNELNDATNHKTRINRRSISVIQSIDHISVQLPYKRFKRGIIPVTHDVKQQDAIIEALGIHDPGYHNQWHLYNYQQPNNDINITGVWQQGITGKNVVIALVDDGIDFTSEDIKDNFFAKGSYDFNDHVKMPMPRLPEDIHGTRCAGEVAAVRNDVCGVGIAYEAKVAGIRILSADITDADEALSLNYGYQDNHIYSCSWGPPDDGQSVDGPHPIVMNAMINAIKKGRGGKGIVFVFASGNGGGFDDHCNCDGYTNSIYSVTVGAIDRFNQHPIYSEACSALMVVTYSSGSGSYIYTTDNGQHSCSQRHGGTSAAAPLVAGIYALVLSIRPDLTWRDIQHLTVRTAIPFNINEKTWSKTAAGYMHSNMYGFGKIDTYRIVEMAKNYTLVNPQTSIESKWSIVNQTIPHGNYGINNTIVLTEAEIAIHGFQKLEHITVTADITHQRRGDIEVYLISPLNIVSKLSAMRRSDESNEGFRNWTFMTVKHWDEPALGPWTINIRDKINPFRTGQLNHWKIKWWGSAQANFTANNTTTATNQSDIINNATPLSDDNTTANATGTDIHAINNGGGGGITDIKTSRLHFISYAAFGVLSALIIAGLAYWAKKHFYDRRRRLRRGYGHDGYEFHALDTNGDIDFSSGLDNRHSHGIIQQARRYVTTRELYEAFGEEDEYDEDNVEMTGESKAMLTSPLSGSSSSSLSSLPHDTLVTSPSTRTIPTGELMYENELLAQDNELDDASDTNE